VVTTAFITEFEVLLLVTVNNILSRNVMPRTLVEIFRRFEGTCCRLQNVEVADSSETVVNIAQSKRLHVLQVIILYGFYS
jgi:hypothetical protein